MDGNGTFRNRGERLAIDPNNPDLLWFGSTEYGLQKGVKSGGSWTTISASAVPFGQVSSGGKAGVTFVTCDTNAGSTITYAGVHDSGGSLPHHPRRRHQLPCRCNRPQRLHRQHRLRRRVQQQRPAQQNLAHHQRRHQLGHATPQP